MYATSTTGSFSIMASSEPTLQKNAATELMVEISLLEKEILYLERRLLSLYQSALKNIFTSSPFSVHSISKSPSCYDKSLAAQELNLPPTDVAAVEQSLNSFNQMRFSPDHKLVSSNTIPSNSPANDQKSVQILQNTQAFSLGHRSLADHLGTSIQDHIPEAACKISEGIIRCIAAIYCRLTTSTNKLTELLPSSSSSCTSSSILSPEGPVHSWSPNFLHEAASNSCQIKLSKHKLDPYNDMIEVQNIRIDDEAFESVCKMLKIMRSLVGQLEAVDPRKMKQHEQLAFWINIHNALMMHALLACGLRHNQIKTTSSIHRAAYHIGGHSVSLYIIQHLILGHSHPHCPSSHIRHQFESIKLKKANNKHPYALDRPEPEACFALCMGASSDPAVRIYTAKHVHQEMKHAKEEYIQAKVCIKEGKIILPKLLDYYAKDASVELSKLIDMISSIMEEDEQRAIQHCFQKKGRNSVIWSPFKTDSRFLVHKELAKY